MGIKHKFEELSLDQKKQSENFQKLLSESFQVCPVLAFKFFNGAWEIQVLGHGTYLLHGSL